MGFKAGDYVWLEYEFVDGTGNAINLASAPTFVFRSTNGTLQTSTEQSGSLQSNTVATYGAEVQIPSGLTNGTDCVVPVVQFTPYGGSQREFAIGPPIKLDQPVLFDGSGNAKSAPQTDVTVSGFSAGAINAAAIASGAFTSSAFASGAITPTTFSADASCGLFGSLTNTASTTPATADNYQFVQMYNGQMAYKSQTLGTPQYIFWDGSSHWNIAESLGGTFQFQGTNGVNDPAQNYAANTGNSGIPAVTGVGGMQLAAVQVVGNLLTTSNAGSTIWGVQTATLTGSGTIGKLVVTTGVPIGPGGLTMNSLGTDVASGLQPYLVVSGTLSNSIAETFRFWQIYNNTRAFKGYASGYFIWFNGTNWIISSAIGTASGAYWTGGSNSAGTYTPTSPATGTATVVSHGNAELASYQPNFPTVTLASSQPDYDPLAVLDDGTHGNAALLTAIEAAGGWGSTLSESYAANGSAATPAQLLYMIYAACSQFVISGTSIVAKKLDGSTTAMTFTMDNAEAPTQRLRTG